MDGQKKENLLNLSLDATEAEREKSPALQVGVNSQEKRWELIVKYNGELSRIAAAFPDLESYPLSGGYAVIRIAESEIESLVAIPQIEYLEKPKRLYFSVNQGKRASCITSLQEGIRGLTGRGVLVAVIDSGIDYLHEAFRNPDGTTRMIELWDQDNDTIYTKEQINAAIQAAEESGQQSEAYERVPSLDRSGHGTAVAGIAVGGGRINGDLRFRGVAYEADLLVVKLGTSLPDSFPRTTELMRALDYAVKRAIALQMPLVVNVSFGNTYGSHDGTSLLETYLDTAASLGRTVIVTGSGNEGNSRGHTSGRVSLLPEEVELLVGTYQTGFGVQLWKQYVDQYSVELISPEGISSGPITPVLGTRRFMFGSETVLFYYGMPSPYSKSQELYFDFIPQGNYLESGVWRFRLVPERIVSGDYDFWLPAEQILSRETRFLSSTPDTTLTIPSTAFRAVTVGAYDDRYQAYADFSGRGFTRLNRMIKPDLAAPGVNIVTAKAGGGYEAVTGTSFAAPFVSGAAALLMQWGMINGNDPYLYGEKLKAYLIRGARMLPSEAQYPNPRLGWGVLCVEDSIPRG